MKKMCSFTFIFLQTSLAFPCDQGDLDPDLFVPWLRRRLMRERGGGGGEDEAEANGGLAMEERAKDTSDKLIEAS